jgi:putative spermidine/putrescine transport system substrate-binding protein
VKGNGLRVSRQERVPRAVPSAPAGCLARIGRVRRPAGAVRARGQLARTRPAACVTALGIAVVLLAACASLSGQVMPAPLSSVAHGEGSLRLLSVSGYVEDGSTDPRVDWVNAFTRRTGCRVSYSQVPDAASIPAAIGRHAAGYYDGVVAPAEVAGQLVKAGLIAPLNTAIVPGYTAISRTLRSQQVMTSKGKTYGVPYVWDALVLGYATPAVRPAPTTWGALFRPASAARYAGKIMLPADPLTIALAALYLKSARPALGIADPYELTSGQFAAAIAVLKSGRRNITQYYSRDTQVIEGLAAGGAVLGGVLPRHVDILARAGRKVAAADPAQGTTGWVSFWQMTAQAHDPNCMYEWLAWSLTPRVQQQVASWNGTAPVNPDACDGLGRQICRVYHVADQAYLDKVSFAQLPGTDCGNGKRDCVGWAKWRSAWKSIAGAPQA